jgi:glycosyltransferase involved in cell wall biosynthesis
VRVLVLHSRYLSGPASGENRVAEDEIRLLEQAGHPVSSWMPEYGDAGGARAAGRAVWSRRAKSRVSCVADSGSADVVHVHNVFPNLSPSVLRSSIATVMTLHNFRLACLPATFLRDGRICEDCLGRAPWPGVLHACYRKSGLASAVLATSLTVHHAVGTFDRVTLYAAVSQFIKDKLVEGGLNRERIRVRHNFSWPIERRVGPGTYFLSVGHLSPEKGLDTIVRNWPSHTALVVVGDGPDRARLESIASGRVEFRGLVDAEHVSPLLRGARSLLVPSRSYEGSPRTIVEAFAAGVSVVASRIGGLPEYVEHEISGLLAEPCDVDEWAEAVQSLEDDDLAERLGDGAYAAWQERFSPEIGLRSLEALYEEAITRAA